MVKSGPSTSSSVKPATSEDSPVVSSQLQTKQTTQNAPGTNEQGLDLSMPVNKQDEEKQAFNYTLRSADDSLSDDSNQPLDLSSKQIDDGTNGRNMENIVSGRNVMLGHAGNLATSSSQSLRPNDDTFPMYHSYYGPGMGMVPNEVPDPAFISPDQPRVLSPGERSLTSLTSPPSANQIDSDLSINPNIAYPDFMSDLVKHQLSPNSDSSPEVVKYTLQNMKYELPEQDQKISLPKYFRMSDETMTSETSPKKGNGKKRPNEMRVISENTSYPGVYTSVLKLPWSRRSRSRKGLRNTMKREPEIQHTTNNEVEMNQSSAMPMVAMQQHQSQQPSVQTADDNYSGSPDSPTLMPIKIPQAPSLNPDTPVSNSVMMVYPNSAFSAQGRPARKRGRPPKLPMLAKLLKNQNKKEKKGNSDSDPVQDQVTQQIQMNGGMLLYNANGQVVTAMGGTQVQPVPVPVPMPMEQGQGQGQTQQTQLQPPMIPNAQFLGQFQLQPQINAAGQLQFVGPSPAQIQALQAQSQQMNSGQGQAQSQGQTNKSQGQTSPTAAQSSDTESTKEESQIKQENVQTTPTPVPFQLPVGYNYAMQPMLIPFPTLNHEAVTGNQPVAVETSPNNLEDRASDLGMGAGDTHIMTHSDTNTISTMSTTSVSNTGSGSIYQEMILSSKSLKEYKPRKRRTTIQQLKAKASDQNFLCTSFRIRPRLVAQAQAQRERMEAKVMETIKMEPKNLNGPQIDTDQFGENNNAEMSLYDSQMMSLNKFQIKQEIQDDEFYGQLKEYGIDLGNLQMENVKDSVAYKAKSEIKQEEIKFTPAKHFPNRRAKNKTFLNKAQVHGEKEADDQTSGNKSAIKANTELEVSKCNICNEIVPSNDKIAHWKKHIPMCYICKSCGTEYQNQEVTDENRDPLHCENCHGDLIKTEMEIPLSRNVFSKVSAQENHLNCQGNMSETENKASYECEVCSKTFEYFHALQFHRKMHKQKKVECSDPECELKFRTIKEMERHYESRHPSSDKKEFYYCTYDRCNKKFLKNFHLQEHVRVKHMKIKAFQCPWPGCPKEFAAERHMKVHLLIHKDEKPIKCEHCDYRCRQRSALNWHMRKHPDQPYPFKRYSSASPTLFVQESE